MWAKCGSQPQIKSAPTQEKVALSGFVNPATGQLVISECEKFNYETIMESVKIFQASQPPKKLLIILDNASWHKKAVRLFREEGSEMEFLFLPPYSPELNPIERVWRITRRERTHNHFFEKLAVLRDTLLTYFNKFSVPNEKLHTLCS